MEQAFKQPGIRSESPSSITASFDYTEVVTPVLPVALTASSFHSATFHPIVSAFAVHRLGYRPDDRPTVEEIEQQARSGRNGVMYGFEFFLTTSGHVLAGVGIGIAASVILAGTIPTGVGVIVSGASLACAVAAIVISRARRSNRVDPIVRVATD